MSPLVEQVLQHLVGLELRRVALVHLPPQQLVALRARHEAALGEMVRRGRGGLADRHAGRWGGALTVWSLERPVAIGFMEDSRRPRGRRRPLMRAASVRTSAK